MCCPTPAFIIAGLGLILSLAAAILYPCLGVKTSHSRSVVKTLAVAPLALFALLMGAPMMALALGLSALGDLALSRPEDRAFLLGMIAFGAAHVVYVVLFTRLGDPALLATFPRVLGALGVLALSVTVAVRLSRGAGAFAIPLRLYIGVIAAMGLAALGQQMTTGGAMIVTGAAMFMASDILIGHERFAGLRFRGLGFAIWGLYYAGQVLILLGVLAQI